MIDPSLDAAGLHHVACSLTTASEPLLNAITRHPSCYPELASWAMAQLMQGHLTEPPPAPPTKKAKPASPKRLGGASAPKKKPVRAGKVSKVPMLVAGFAGLALLGVTATVAGVQGWFNGVPAPGQNVPPPTTQPAEAAPSLEASGESFSCTSEGANITCYGSNKRGQIGAPLSQPGGSNTITLSAAITSLTAGKDFACASSGTGVTCWGDSRWGQTGVEGGDSMEPASIALLETETIVDLWAGDAHACAASTTQVWCWGSNTVGQVGIKAGDKPHKVPVPVELGDEHAITGLSGSRFTTCVLREGDGGDMCWGSNSAGEINPSDERKILAPTPRDAAATTTP